MMLPLVAQHPRVVLVLSGFGIVTIATKAIQIAIEVCQ